MSTGTGIKDNRASKQEVDKMIVVVFSILLLTQTTDDKFNQLFINSFPTSLRTFVGCQPTSRIYK